MTKNRKLTIWCRWSERIMKEDWRGSKGARCGMNAYKQEECKKTNNGVKKTKMSKYKLRQTVVFTRTKHTYARSKKQHRKTAATQNERENKNNNLHKFGTQKKWNQNDSNPRKNKQVTPTRICKKKKKQKIRRDDCSDQRESWGGNIVESMGARTEIDAKKQRTSKKTKESVKKTKSKQFIGA